MRGDAPPSSYRRPVAPKPREKRGEKSENIKNIVIPAKAGIQWAVPIAKKSIQITGISIGKSVWIPAFAGMTRERERELPPAFLRTQACPVIKALFDLALKAALDRLVKSLALHGFGKIILA